MKASIIAVCGFCVFSFAAFAAESVSTVQANTSERASQTSKIDLNTAPASVIAHAVKGIGTKRAEAIITYREAHQGFKSIEELAQVPGIGKRFVESHLASLEAVFQIK